MASRTPRFRFNYFGSGVNGTPNDDGQKFFGLDRVLLDRLLAQVERHDHRYQPPAQLFEGPLESTLLDAGGLIQGGYSYFYRYSVVDEFGNESMPGPELEVITPALLTIPAMAPAFYDEVSAGTLAPGIYYYALTALRGSEETPIGPASFIQVLPGNGSVTLDLPDFGDADTFRVWRMGSTDVGYTRIGLVADTETQFVDDGSVPPDPCACDPGNQPPASNTGTASYSVELTLPLDVDLTNARSWRLYRSMSAGVYPTASLVHEVVEREDEWSDLSPLLRAWVDTGQNLQTGKPMDSDLNMRFSALTFDSAGTLPDVAPYPAGYPLLVDGALYVKQGAEWSAVTGGGGGAFNGVMTSPAGIHFILSVDDTGTLTTTPTYFPGPPRTPTGLTAF